MNVTGPIQNTEQSPGQALFRVKLKLGLIRAAAAFHRRLLSICRGLLFRRLELPGHEKSIRRILVYRIGNVGDIVVTIPVLAQIRARFPEAHICLLTSPGRLGAPGADDILQVGEWLDSVWTYHNHDIATWKGRLALVNKVRAGNFDLFVELSNVLAPLRSVFKDLALARLGGCRFAVGFEARTIRWFLRQQATCIPQLKESDRLYRSLSGPLNLAPQHPVRLPVTTSAREAIRQKLTEAGIADLDVVIVMHVGAKRSLNRWMPERYAALADALHTQYGLRTALTGAPGDRELVEQVVRGMHSEAVNFCGRLTLQEVAALLERARIYIGNDTGPMHISAAVGTPVVSIFSARDFPVQWYPYGPGHTVLRKDVPCSPCLAEICRHNLACLEQVGLDEVLAAVQQQLSRIGLHPLGRLAAAGSDTVPVAGHGPQLSSRC